MFGGAQRTCGDHLHQIQLGGCRENPYFEKKWPIFPVCMWKWGGSIFPIWPSAPLVTKWAPMCKKAMPLGSPPHQGLKKNCGLSQKNDLFFDLFWGANGVPSAVCALLAIFRSWHTLFFLRLRPGRLNPTWAAGKALISKNSLIYGICGHIHTCSPGPLQGHL